MKHIADIWREFDELTRVLALQYPEVGFTCIRDVYGRCSFALERVSEEQWHSIQQTVGSRQDLLPYLGSMRVQPLKEGSTLAKTIQDLRRSMGEPPNAFLVERLLSNESWIRGPDSNPQGWPPVVAFYSFKGGVGRTTTTALTALTLAREGKRVVVIDLDLEAPGIEGYFFPPGDEEGQPEAGVVDYILEREVLGDSYKPDIDDFVLPYSDPAIAANGGSLLIVSAGRLDGTYMERLGRINLADIGRKRGTANPLRALIGDVVAWRPADIVLVDCRTGFTDLGGITLNGLSTLDVLVFRGGEADRRYLPLVLKHIQRFRDVGESPLQKAEQLARSFLVLYTLVDLPPKAEEARQYVEELRRHTSEACWKHIFEPFADSGYAYPSDQAQDSPLEPVPHDVVLIPYLRDFFMVASVTDMLRLQAERPERPYDTLVRRIMDVKLAPPEAATAQVPPAPQPSPGSERQQVLEALSQLVGSPSGEREFQQPEDFRLRFLPRTAYRTLLDPRAFLILGRKGAGKSALFQILTRPEEARHLARHLQLDAGLVERTRWEVGFAAGPGFPSKQDFLPLLEMTGEDPDLLAAFWQALAAMRFSQALGRPLAGLTSLEDCTAKLKDSKVQAAIRQWLQQLDSDLAGEDRYCCLSYDDLDTGLSRDTRRRGLLVSALVEHWQQSVKYWPRLRAKIFLREDIWLREVQVTDKAKVRDGIDRGTLTWDGPDIYRAVLKRLGSVPAFKHLLHSQSLWRPDFGTVLNEPLGFIPPNDEDWIRQCIHLLAGETMASGPSGHKKGYVYTWVLNHAADAAGQLRPRNALLLFSEAAKLQGAAEKSGPLMNPRRFLDALRGSVSELAVADLGQEFKEEWSVNQEWLPDLFSTFERTWPVDEGKLVQYLQKTTKLPSQEVKEKLEHMADAGLLERRPRGGKPQLQIPDIYLFGLGLTRKGG
jgi:hypothetical protein